MFSVGEQIVHPMHGAGKVDSVVSRKVAGVTREYYVLHIPVGDITLMIPVDSADTVGLRAVTCREEAQRIMDEVPGLTVPDFGNWNQRYRENMDRLRSGSLLEVARVIKGLLIRGQNKPLSTGERRMLLTARQIFLSEMVLALDCPAQTLETKLNRSILGRDAL